MVAEGVGVNTTGDGVVNSRERLTLVRDCDGSSELVKKSR